VKVFCSIHGCGVSLDWNETKELYDITFLRESIRVMHLKRYNAGCLIKILLQDLWQ